MSRGGKRPGSGRKPDPNRKIAYKTRLRPYLVEWLKSRDNAAVAIEKALVETYNLKKD